ncbi:hypothetical protein [Accumulibacter sp.]|uniref:hypothetical protein n=1 Tax=Accumulibacter sp. TaxID=2053492 RepID=UPI002627A797|nr:hypothetical protein [Accumulibacter sp.]
MVDAGQGEVDPQAQPAPHYEFDPRIAWQRPHENDVSEHALTQAGGLPARR